MNRMANQKVCKGYDFSGIYVPITTPFNNDESIAWDKLESNIKKMNSTKIKGYVVQGSTGEFCYLSTEEKLQTIERVRFWFIICNSHIDAFIKSMFFDLFI